MSLLLYRESRHFTYIREETHTHKWAYSFTHIHIIYKKRCNILYIERETDRQTDRQRENLKNNVIQREEFNVKKSTLERFGSNKPSSGFGWMISSDVKSPMGFLILLSSPDDGLFEPKRSNTDFRLTLNPSLWITLFFNFSLYCQIYVPLFTSNIYIIYIYIEIERERERGREREREVCLFNLILGFFNEWHHNFRVLFHAKTILVENRKLLLFNP